MALMVFSYALSQGVRITEHKLVRKQGPGKRVRWSQSAQDAQIQALRRIPAPYYYQGYKRQL
jgi:hypothetical protein